MLKFIRHRVVFLLCAVTGLVHSFAPNQVAFSLRKSVAHHPLRRWKASSADASPDTTDGSQSSSFYLEDKLTSLLKYFQEDPETLPCGLECTNGERELVVDIITDLLALQNDEDPSVPNPNNLVRSKNGRLAAADVLGTWDLLYTSSRIMISNKSLSGLGHTASSLAQFAGLEQKITGSQFLGFTEYTERFGSEEADSSFDITIKGEWLLQYDYTDPFTGAPTTAIRVDPEGNYGPLANEGLASLGPIKLLNIVYLTDDLQIARGNANPDSIFVFQKKQ